MRNRHVVLGEECDLLSVDLHAMRRQDLRPEQVVGREMAYGSEARGRDLTDRRDWAGSVAKIVDLVIGLGQCVTTGTPSS